MFDPPLTQHTDKAILDPWIWTGTIIAMIMFFTMSGLFTPVTNEAARNADGIVTVAQGSPTPSPGTR
jgi:hypothetical protein